MVGDASPDRVDALVWALTELFPRIVRAVKQPAAATLPKLPRLAGVVNERGTGWMGRR
jgi:hypothetical protein